MFIADMGLASRDHAHVDRPPADQRILCIFTLQESTSPDSNS
jgi:hypothetical protein